MHNKRSRKPLSKEACDTFFPLTESDLFIGEKFHDKPIFEQKYPKGRNKLVFGGFKDGANSPSVSVQIYR
ncbi:hypothetical protein [Priestia megaterium]|uniref:hypothetical protein n=1 Tax=Priestia megaterium TaxID=1404 RepID=UPI000BFB2F4C|nr:hypothetical protein [Priestia megaterium]PGQ88351.1 hypothetical protein COA18_05320 [Priestia megaterium]